MSTVDTSTAEELNQGGSDFILTSSRLCVRSYWTLRLEIDF